MKIITTIIREVIPIIIAWILWYLIYIFLLNQQIIDDKQDIFLEDREFYQQEISKIQSKLDNISNQVTKISNQLEIDTIQIVEIIE